MTTAAIYMGSVFRRHGSTIAVDKLYSRHAARERGAYLHNEKPTPKQQDSVPRRRAHRILSCRTDPRKRAEALLDTKEFSCPATSYGISTEAAARRKFEAVHGVSVQCFGLVVASDDPWLANSPDGVFRSPDGMVHLLEIKCPKSREQKKVSELPLLSYLCTDENGLHLRKTHTYYTQVQINLHVLDLKTCSFFIYTKVDFETIEVVRDNNFLSAAVPRLRIFYFEHLLPSTLRAELRRRNKMCSCRPPCVDM
ncbi:uncharacterized protein LOC135387696 [Ornithodoros turicata]|uniref:uncharacterized protein LOC135387696 n=1 Tax=Ornithodoros turicata TaxID=34597 RepID=UPI003139CC0F